MLDSLLSKQALINCHSALYWQFCLKVSWLRKNAHIYRSVLAISVLVKAKDEAKARTLKAKAEAEAEAWTLELANLVKLAIYSQS